MSNGRKKCALLAKALSPSIPPLLHIYQGSEISFWGEGENGGKHSESKEKGRVMVVAEKAERGEGDRPMQLWPRELSKSWTIFPKKDLLKKREGVFVFVFLY